MPDKHVYETDDYLESQELKEHLYDWISKAKKNNFAESLLNTAIIRANDALGDMAKEKK
jgi:hypothetical protein